MMSDVMMNFQCHLQLAPLMRPINILQQEKFLASKSEYKYCKYLVSSTDTLAHFKQLLSVDMEKQAVVTLL